MKNYRSGEDNPNNQPHPSFFQPQFPSQNDPPQPQLTNVGGFPPFVPQTSPTGPVNPTNFEPPPPTLTNQQAFFVPHRQTQQLNQPAPTPATVQPQQQYQQDFFSPNLQHHQTPQAFTPSVQSPTSSRVTIPDIQIQSDIFQPSNKQQEDEVDLKADPFITPSEENFQFVENPKVSTYWNRDYLNISQSKSVNLSMTLNAVPNSNILEKKLGLPIAVTVSPFANERNENITVIETGENMLRCLNCKTYVNPYFQWLENGRLFRCNVCKFISKTPDFYICELDENGIRKDISERPELQHGTVEFVAPSNYTPRTPQPASYFFAIDVSSSAVKSGALKCYCESILDICEEISGDERTMIGILTFDETVHFYDLDDARSKPKMIVVPDLRLLKQLTPYRGILMVNLKESINLVKMLLESIPRMFQDTRIVNSCLGSALNSAGAILGRIGGVLLVFTASIPTVGAHDLGQETIAKIKEDERKKKSKKKKKNAEPELPQPLLSDISDYMTLGNLFSIERITVHVFAASNGSAYLNLKSLVPMVKITGGNLYHYSHFAAMNEAVKMRSDVQFELCRTYAFESVMRVRVSGDAFEVRSYLGSFIRRKKDLLVMSAVNETSSVAMHVRLKTGTFTSPMVSVQSALLYTNVDGERRIRVNNLVVPVVQTLKEVFVNIKPFQMAAVMGKICAYNTLKIGRVNEAYQSIVNQLACSVYNYRFSITQRDPNSSSSTKLVIPKRLLFVIYQMHGVVSSDLFDGMSGLDLKISVCLRILNSMPAKLQVLFTPKLYDCVKYTPLRLSRKYLNGNGLYVIVRDNVIIVFIGFLFLKKQKVVGEEILRFIEEYNEKQGVDEDLLKGIQDENVRKVAAIVQLNSTSYFVPVMAVHIESSKEMQGMMNKNFFEDKQENKLSYTEFVYKIARV